MHYTHSRSIYTDYPSEGCNATNYLPDGFGVLA